MLCLYIIEGADYFKDIKRCIWTRKGEEYIGEISITKTGKECKMWSIGLENSKLYTGTYFSNKNVTLAKNYCRNPNSNPNGPWCLLEDDANSLEVCNIPSCEKEDNCKDTKAGEEYSGFTNVTTTGISCQKWMEQSPHVHEFQESNFPENNFKITGNNCRNPNNRISPWCYTTDSTKTWDYCKIKQCKKKISQVEYFQKKKNLESLDTFIADYVTKELVYNATVFITVKNKRWTKEFQDQISVWSSEYSYECQKDLDFYEYCHATQIIKNKNKVTIEFFCDKRLQTIIILSLEGEEKYESVIKDGPVFVVNNVLSPALVAFRNKLLTEETVENSEISVSDNGSPFYLFDDNVIPYAVSKENKVVMTISNVGKGRIGIMGGQYYNKVGDRKNLLNFFKRVAGSLPMKPKILTRKYFQNLRKIWKSKTNFDFFVIWDAHKELKRENIRVLLNMVKDGLILIVEIKPWAYAKYTNKFLESELKELFWEAGVWPSEDVIQGNLRVIKTAELNFFPLIYLIEYAKSNMNALLSVEPLIIDNLSNIDYYDISKRVLSLELLQKLKVTIAELYQIYLSKIKFFVPCLKKPLVNKTGMTVFRLFNEILLKSLGNNFIAPGINFYPGTIRMETIPLESFKIKLKLKFNNENVYTGIYIQAGQEITVYFTTLKSKECTLFINFHLFDISKMEKFDKWPKTRTEHVVEPNKTNTLVNSFGGLLSITCAVNEDYMDLEVNNVVQVAIYDRRNKALSSNWNSLKKRNVPWAILAGDCIVFIVPIIAARNLEDPEEILKIWDTMVKEEFHVRGRLLSNTYRELLSTDIQILAGYMHSGYPIGTFMQNIANPAVRETYLFSKDVISKIGYWGITHEIGHNLQHDIFTFSGTDEVTNNIFTLSAIEAINGFTSWSKSQGWVSEKNLPKIIKHIKNRNFKFWKNDPYVGLGTYAQLRAHFGWEFYRQVFRNYDKLIIEYGKRVKPITDEEKINLWIIETSKISGMNLTPLYDYWAWPISEEIKVQLDKFTPFLPDDFLTKMTENEVTKILAKYENISRKPLLVPIVVGPLKDPLIIEGGGGIEEITRI